MNFASMPSCLNMLTLLYLKPAYFEFKTCFFNFLSIYAFIYMLWFDSIPSCLIGSRVVVNCYPLILLLTYGLVNSNGFSLVVASK